MKKYIILIFTVLQFLTFSAFSQFTTGQMDELTARGMYYAIEPDSYRVKKKAQDVTDYYIDKSYVQSICAIFDNVYRNWTYEADPNGMEYFQKASISVQNYTGDCDDYATLMVSMIKAIGGDGRVVCVSGHAYPEVYIGRDLTKSQIAGIMEKIDAYYQEKGSRIRVKYLNYHHDADGTQWLNLDYQDNYPGGTFVEYSEYASHLVIYGNGSYERTYLNK